MQAGELDAEKLGVLRSWGEGLERDQRHEVAAAGRAILMLVDEIERLHVLLWNRHVYPEEMAVGPIDEPLSERGREDPLPEASDFDAADKSLLRRVKAQFARQTGHNG